MREERVQVGAERDLAVADLVWGGFIPVLFSPLDVSTALSCALA